MALALETVLDEVEALQTGSRQRSGLRALGIQTVADLVQHFPRRYEDRRRLADFPAEELPGPVCLAGVVRDVSLRRFGRRQALVEALLEERGEPGAFGTALVLRWFNTPWVGRQLAVGQELVLFGRPKRSGKRIVVDQPEFEILESALEEETGVESVHLGRITPVYALSSGIPQRTLRDLIFRALAMIEPGDVPELLPPRKSNRHEAGPQRWQALQDIHFPREEEDREAARRVLALQECFTLQLNVAFRRQMRISVRRPPRCGSGRLLQAFLETLPFQPTQSQRRAVGQIRLDLESATPMNRLLQGDVGSGKTFVAVAAMLFAVENGAQAALMAPTQVLAEQHFLLLRRWLEPLDLCVSLRTGTRQVDGFLPLLAGGSGEPQIVVGTHALLYEKAGLQDLGLVVIDEQHKFGVLQRTRLAQRGDHPDLLVMTATPIPRTLTMTVYGDLDISVLDELPAGRGPLRTHLRSLEHEAQAAQYVRDQIAKGRQAFVLCPLVEESDKLPLSDALSTQRNWRELLGPGIRCGLLHGRLTAEEKEEVMRSFRSGETAVLVATTVIEVGVDVPNATIMVVLHAERFGLSQLHQLRGRVGRGTHPSHCILLCDPGKPEAADRLKILGETRDGFRIAEEDLRQRGPGDLLGTAQSGLPALRLADLLSDADLLQEARELADAVLARDPSLALPEHAVLRGLLRDGDGPFAGTA